MDAPPQLPSTTSSGISASGTLSDAAASLLNLFLFLFSTSFSQSYHIPTGAPSSVLHSARHHPSLGISSHSHGEVMPGLFHDASGKVAHEVRHVYIHACLHALEVAWGRGFVAHDLGVPARTLVRLPEVATRWVRSLHLIRILKHMYIFPSFDVCAHILL